MSEPLTSEERLEQIIKEAEAITSPLDTADGLLSACAAILALERRVDELESRELVQVIVKAEHLQVGERVIILADTLVDGGIGQNLPMVLAWKYPDGSLRTLAEIRTPRIERIRSHG